VRDCAGAEQVQRCRGCAEQQVQKCRDASAGAKVLSISELLVYGVEVVHMCRYGGVEVLRC